MTKMNHKILLGAAITLASLQQAYAVPFAPSDARSMGMGGTGVASAEVASTVQFNPALLATTREDDHFGLKLPQFSLAVADDNGFIDEAEDFDEESELAPGSDKTNIDLLSDLLEDVTDNGIPTLEAALDDIDQAVTPAQFQTAQTNLNAAIAGLDGQLFSTNVNLDPDLVVYSDAIASDLEDLNNKALRINGGLNIAGAIPSKKFSMAVHAGAQVTFSGRVIVSSDDTGILRNYSAATSAYLGAVNDLSAALTAVNTGGTTAAELTALQAAQEAVDDFNYGGAGRPESEGDTAIFVGGELSPEAEDADLDSEIQMIGVAVADVGVTASRVFNIKGHDISFGITPKLQKISIFDYTHPLDGKDENGNDVEFDSEDFSENQEDYTAFNIDLGAAYQFGAEKQWQAGLVIKNLIGDDYESAEYISSNGVGGAVVSISPMMRAGISHRTSWTKVAFDLDITENDPVAFEDPTQYAAIGGELNVWRIVQLRAGYRANLAGSDQDIMTAGIGISPGPVHLDIGVMANTSDIENEAGIALEFGVEF
ncbi:MAG: conjugal transfer protein TraF [Bermanella sp.]